MVYSKCLFSQKIKDKHKRNNIFFEILVRQGLIFTPMYFHLK